MIERLALAVAVPAVLFAGALFFALVVLHRRREIDAVNLRRIEPIPSLPAIEEPALAETWINDVRAGCDPRR